MPDAFAPALERWHDFYMLSGSAAAALLGLLFVSVSLHLDALSGDGQALAYETFFHFMATLFLALVCLMPGLTPVGLGAALLALGLLGCARLARHRLRYRVAFPHPRRRDVLPALAYVLLVGVGGLLMASQSPLLGGLTAADFALLLGGLTAVTFLLLIQAALSAWEMLLYLGAGHGQPAGPQATDHPGGSAA
jgi:hypothetical protein